MMRRFLPATAAFIIAATMPGSGQWAMRRAQVVFPDDTTVAVEVADTEVLRQRGLMFRESLAEGEGMIFVFDRVGHYPFWMKNTLIPLDMFWLDDEASVVAIAHSVPPCKADPCPTYPPPNATGPARYVVEVVSGFARAHGVAVGDRLRLEGVAADQQD